MKSSIHKKEKEKTSNKAPFFKGDGKGFFSRKSAKPGIQCKEKRDYSEGFVDDEDQMYQSPIQKKGIGSILQKQEAPAAEEAPQAILNQAEVQDAISYNRRRYDEENIRQIQRLTGQAQTGVLDEETVQAIARFQQSQGLEDIDGKAGPDTFTELTDQLANEGADDQTCLTMFHVSYPVIPMRMGAPAFNQADMFSEFNIEIRFSPNCNCNEWQYRQYIGGDVTVTRAGVVTNLNNIFLVPGGGLPGLGNWVQDGNTTNPNNGHYGHRRNGDVRPENRYEDENGNLDMQNGCVFRASDTPGLWGVNVQSGDQFDFNIRFFGDIERNGIRQQRKYWSVRDTVTIP